MKDIQPYGGNFIEKAFEGEVVSHLTSDELEKLTNAFYNYYEEEENKVHKARARNRAKYLMIFLFLRYTGARLSEVLQIDESRGIDFRNSEVVLRTLKRHSKKKKNLSRVVPIPEHLISDYLRIVKLHPEIEGKAFKVKSNNFFIVFRAIAKSVGIPDTLAHPHILRHTRAIELLKSGVPVTIVQQLLGHASLATTAVYLKYSATEAKRILKDRGMI